MEKVENVVDVYSHIDNGSDMPMWIITYYDQNKHKFDVVEVVEGSVKLIKATDQEILRKFEDEKKKVQKINNELGEKYDKVLRGECLFCGSKLFPIKAKWAKIKYSYYDELRYCPNCKIVWARKKYPSPCHYSENLTAIKGNKIIYRLEFDYYRSPLIPRFRELKVKVIE